MVEPKLLYSARVSSQNRKISQQPPFPPGSPSRSVSAETAITSGKAAGMNVEASTVELPAAATNVIPAAWAWQMASRMPPSVQVPTDPTSPRLMLATMTSLVGSPSVARPVR